MNIRCAIRLGAALVAAASGGGCGSSPAQGAGPTCPGSFTVVFLDRSVSVERQSGVEGVEDSIRSLASRALRCPGDELHAFVIHGATRGKAFRVDQKHDVSMQIRESPLWAHLQDSIRVQQNLQHLHSEAAAKLAQLWQTNYPGLNRSRSDVMGSLEVASKELADAPPQSRKEVIFVSDMHESTARRDFDRLRPLNRDIAHAWARADSAHLRDMDLKPERFRDVAVRVYATPWRATEEAPYVEAYWTTLFRLAGIREDSIRYN